MLSAMCVSVCVCVDPSCYWPELSMRSNTDLTQKTESAGHVPDTHTHTHTHTHTNTNNTYFCSLKFAYMNKSYLFNLGLLDLLQGNSDIVCLQLCSLFFLHTHTQTHRWRQQKWYTSQSIKPNSTDRCFPSIHTGHRYTRSLTYTLVLSPTWFLQQEFIVYCKLIYL